MHSISWLALTWCFIPIGIACSIYLVWQGDVKEILLASLRMVLQLVGVGYVLVALFHNPSPWLTLLVMGVMLSAAAWIAIRPVRHHLGYLKPAVFALSIAVCLHLFLSVKLVLGVDPWFLPKVVIPLAGMYFANTMNAVSLATERFHANIEDEKSAQQARITAFKGAMIPQVNALFAVGLVSLPGMMTGQILSDVSPLIAVRYQIMIMTMMLGSSASGAAIMLWQLERQVRRSAN